MRRHTQVRVIVSQFRLRLVVFLVLFASFGCSWLSGQAARGGTDAVPCSRNAIQLQSSELLGLVVKRVPVENQMIDGSTLHGVVTVAICINNKGRLVNARVVRGHPIAQSFVLDSIRQWVFSPYKKNGRARPVTGILEVEFDFRSHPSSTKSPR
jgi:TonB family protein